MTIRCHGCGNEHNTYLFNLGERYCCDSLYNTMTCFARSLIEIPDKCTFCSEECDEEYFYHGRSKNRSFTYIMCKDCYTELETGNIRKTCVMCHASHFQRNVRCDKCEKKLDDIKEMFDIKLT